MNHKTITLLPRITEKANDLAAKQNVYVFDVPMGANKHVVAAAVAAQYEVAVESVRTTLVKGKAKRTTIKSRRPIKGRQSDVKKAYVTLKEGNKLPFFDEPEKKDSKKSKQESQK